MSQQDPYAALGVPRTATRDEIARAYRRLAKQHHPDRGTPMTQQAMVRLNDAWHVLSDPARRARWDRLHAVVAPPHWVQAPAGPRPRRPAREPEAPPSPMDSGWVVAGIVGAIVVAVAALMAGVSMVSQAVDDRLVFSADELSFAHPPEWTVAPGDGTDPADHRVVAHVVTYDVEQSRLCTSFSAPCDMTGASIPPGEASLIITAWEGGTPRVPDPLASLPYGLEGGATIGGAPAASETRDFAREAVLWWQLSPPGFPDRWIEIRASVGGRALARTDVLREIDTLLDSVAFESGSP